MTVDIQKLKALAERLSQADWFTRIDLPPCSPEESDFIASANPAAVLELIAEIEYLKLEMSGVERAKQDLAVKLGCADEPRWKWLLCGADDLIKERDQLKAENESLRKDAERYRWLRRGENYAHQYLIDLGMENLEGFDRSIDAAMSKEASHDVSL